LSIEQTRSADLGRARVGMELSNGRRLELFMSLMRKHCICLCLLAVLSPQTAWSQTDAWLQLFNGRDLAGWKHAGRGKHTVKEGFIRTHRGSGVLYWTGGKLGNCVIRVVYKMRHRNDNSGVFIRMPGVPTELEGEPVHGGYEVQIDNEPEKSGEDEFHVTGTLYSFTKPLAKPGKPGSEWNTMEITLDGPHTLVVLNGVKVTDFTEGDPVPAKKLDFEPERGPRPLEGYIGLQNHSRHDVVFFKEVAVRKLGD
jgi:hypothetical protein